jgi:hypothetical protein
MNKNKAYESTHGEFTVREERTWSKTESSFFKNPFLDNAACFAPHPTSKVDLTLAKVFRNTELLGIAPVIRLIKYRATRLLKPEYKKWMDPMIGILTYETTCLIDTSFMAYQYADPFMTIDPKDLKPVREAIIAHLQNCKGVDNIMISEPAGDPTWAQARGFMTFMQLPLVRVELDDCQSLDDYLMSLSQKRRRNFRKEQKLFKKRGGFMEVVAPPHSPELLTKLYPTLLSSSAQNKDFEVPFEELYNSLSAFETQKQWLIVAREGDKIAGFFAFILHGTQMYQCHGGLDYRYSLSLKAYQNLLHESVCYAVDNGFRHVSFGPLNNEAKRRAGTLAPIMSAFWLRKRLSRWMMRNIMLKKMQIYCGE